MFRIHGVIGRARSSLFASVACFVALSISSPQAFAVQARPDAFQDMQPDGTVIELRVHGDEHFNWAEDSAGFTVLHHKGWYQYARLNPEGRLVPSGLKVGLDNPRANGLTRGLQPSPQQRVAGAKGTTDGNSGGGTGSAVSIEPFGAVRNLVVLVRFSNHVDRALPSSVDIDVLFNAPGGDPTLAPTGSVRDVFLQNSYGQMELNSDVAPWVTVSGTEQYYANGVSGDSTLWEALREALDGLDGTVDFSQYDRNNDGYIDSIAFLHSGYGAEWGQRDADGAAFSDRIWSHQWSMDPVWTSKEGVKVGTYHIAPALWGTDGQRIGRIGVIAHETGHFLGLPDLYDTDGVGAGIGSYGLMANSWGFTGMQTCPPHLSPWSKLQLGWIDPVDISQSGTYSLAQSATNNEYFVITEGYPANEYLMIENRQRAGFDCSMPQGGLAIWHIDDEAGFNTEGYPGKRWPKDGKHYRVALAQADGDFYLELGANRGDAGDVHHAGAVDAMAPGPDGHPNTDAYQNGRIIETGHTITNISAAGPVMTFCLNGCGDGGSVEPGGVFNAPSGLVATVTGSARSRVGNNTVTLNWTDNSDGTVNEDLFVIERCEVTGKGKRKVCTFAEHATVAQDVTTFSEPEGYGSFHYRVKARRNSDTGTNGIEDTSYSNEVGI